MRICECLGEREAERFGADLIEQGVELLGDVGLLGVCGHPQRSWDSGRTYRGSPSARATALTASYAGWTLPMVPTTAPMPPSQRSSLPLFGFSC